MPYITIKTPPRYANISFDDILNNTVDMSRVWYSTSETSTRTSFKENLPQEFIRKFYIARTSQNLFNFCNQFKHLINAPVSDFYTTFYVEKKGKGMRQIFRSVFDSQKKYIDCSSKDVCRFIADTLSPVIRQHTNNTDDQITSDAMAKITEYLTGLGFVITPQEMLGFFKSAYRRIDAPNAELKKALNSLKDILEDTLSQGELASYHTAAFAYIKGRSTIDAVKKHQQNESRWFAKFDFSNFFGNTTPEFVMQSFRNIFPFSQLLNNVYNREVFEKCIKLCFLNGGLPQGTPISPFITNVMMIPIDFQLFNTLRKHDKKFVYTRYADDIIISSRYDFNVKELEITINSVLQGHNAPFQLNADKTRYGSYAGRNWNLGVMLNQNHDITVGYKNRKKFRAACYQYILAKRANNPWDLSEVQHFAGILSYYKMVEKDYFTQLLRFLNKKYSCNIESMLKADLKV